MSELAELHEDNEYVVEICTRCNIVILDCAYCGALYCPLCERVKEGCVHVSWWELS